MSVLEATDNAVLDEMFVLLTAGDVDGYRAVRARHPNVNPNDYRHHSGRSLLQMCCVQNRPEAVEYLLEEGLCDVEFAVQNTRLRAVHFAARLDDDGRTLSALIRAGADIEAASIQGATPLRLACMAGATSSSPQQLTPAALLLNAGADVNAADKNGDTGLNTACRSGNVLLIEMLLAAGADPRLKSGDGKQPYQLLRAALKRGTFVESEKPVKDSDRPRAEELCGQLEREAQGG